MQNLRIVNAKVNSSTEIYIKFTDNLNLNLIPENFLIKSETSGAPDSEVLSVVISGLEVSLLCQPLTNLASYRIICQSLPQHPFISLENKSLLLEDGVANIYSIVGPIDPDNPIKLYVENILKDGVYRVEDTGTVVNTYLRSIAQNFAKALYDIRAVKNENYLSVGITDERKVRGDGPFDRLLENGAYEVVRVGRSRTGANATKTLQYSNFSYYPITLQQELSTEILKTDSINQIGKFNINDLILNLNNAPVSKLISVIFTLNSANPIYNYNIEKYGYQILNNQYDQDYGYRYLSITENQIKLNNEILSDPLFSINNIVSIEVQYQYKNKGIIVNGDTLSLTTVKKSAREVLPPIINIFNLKYAPIVDAGGKTPTANGVTFIDPNTNVPGSKHPAFVTEIPFRLSALPSFPGQYSIDYSTGTVYVYGSDLNNDGTGPFPPLATYNYQFTYKNDQDYTYDPTTYDLVSLPIGNLRGNDATVSFKYEQVLIPGIDYNPLVHKENLTERIGNKLLSFNSLKVSNSPITNVFRVYNETSGEIYIVDRWSEDRIYFKYRNRPNVQVIEKERVSFATSNNEVLFINQSLFNTGSLKIYKILLKNSGIIGNTEDGIGNFTNTTITFSNSFIFKNEKWFNNSLGEENINNLFAVGDYCVDYSNGIVYCAVDNSQNFNVGTISYKFNQIAPFYPHLISVEDIYYQINALSVKNKQFEYSNFGDGFINISGLEESLELYLNNNTLSPYQIFNGDIGSFVESNFVSGVTNQVNFIRGIFEYNDLLNSSRPINFVNYSVSNNFNINVGSYSKSIFTSVMFDGTNHYVLIDENIPYLSSNIEYNFSIIRTSDSAELWVGGTIVPGDPVKLILSGYNNPNANDFVNVSYQFTINNLSQVAVDYSKGDFFVDYTYLADEIIVSYEYGDNALDFRQSKSVSSGTEYFVSYKVGALRDALLRNFGNLVNIPELSNFDIDFDRERYRDALTAAMSSFIQGPTVTALKNIGKTISHIQPVLTESIFEGWSLGSSLLNPQEIKTTGAFSLLPAKYLDGVLINSTSQSINFPTSSNIRLEEGTFENWVVPQWNGIDNDADLVFNIIKNGNPVLPTDVFIGSGEYHPQIINNTFKLNKNSGNLGTPNINKDGIFIYYDQDPSGKFNRWYLRIIDGYVDAGTATYKIKISSNGSFYDAKSVNSPQPSNLSIFTGVNSLNVSLTGNTSVSDTCITFISDIDHYLLDFGADKGAGRLSIFKDISGYLNFRVYDVDRNQYLIGADVSHWKIGEPHHIAASWKLNNPDGRDEMHLFVDGIEVPNIIKYGQKLNPYLHQKFRTVNQEEILGLVNRDIVSSIDLKTVAGNNTVSSSLNFSSYNIFIGDIIYIDEIGFNPLGYSITNINGQILTLNQAMPITLNDARFSVNRTQFTVSSGIDIAPNFAVSTLHAFIQSNDLSTVAGSNVATSASYNFSALGVLPGFLLRINNPLLDSTYTIASVSGNTITLIDNLPITLTGASFQIYSGEEDEIPGLRATRPSYSVSKDINYNNILILSNNVFAGDLVLIRTLGLNNRSFKHRHYMWSNNSENIIKTRLPAPISLDEVVVKKVILPSTAIGPANSILSGGSFISNNLSAYPTSNSQNGRTISVTLSGTNTDFSNPTSVTINGIVGIYTISETISFTEYGTLDSANQFLTVNYVQVSTTPINPSKNALNIECREKYSITKSESSGIVPTIKFSYYMNGGYTLYSDSPNSVRDENNIFSDFNVGNYLIITSPAPSAGYYYIVGVSEDKKTLYIQSTTTSFPLPLPGFTDGTYEIVRTNEYRSGLQNGFFTFEVSNMPSQEYYLTSGFYDIEYSTYTKIKMPPLNMQAWLGTDFNGQNPFNGVIDQLKIYSTMLTDTRIGETIPANQRSITKDYNSLRPLTYDANTLMLVNFDSFPFLNFAKYYIGTNDYKKLFQSSIVVNENFGHSTVFLNKPIIIDNDGVLDTRKEGTIEFWINPLFDTANDPNDRYYFDAFGAVTEEAISVNNTAVKLRHPISKVLNVKLKNGDPKIDYFVGGKVEIDSQNAVQEEAISTSNTSLTVSKPILQVMKVQIAGDLTELDYFIGGSIGTDKKTIYLGKALPSNNLPVLITYKSTENQNIKLNTQVIRLNRKLPHQNSQVLVTYIPQGLQGDRVSIFKDKFGYMNFSIHASGSTYTVQAPVFWSKHTWHRVKASYKINGGIGSDEMQLFLDGYQHSDIVFDGSSTSPLFINLGDGYSLRPNIKFKDSINQLYLGTDYLEANPIFSLVDNFRISNLSRPLYAPYGEPIDVNYNSNLTVAFPVTEDLYTTYLLNFDKITKLNDDFATIRNRKTGIFDFSLNILDSFGIVSSSIKVQEALEKLIKVLKPANSKVFIQYTK